ncbi:hypothetical protein OPKNFCMD_4510 [Methylobacterium crusticola]|uniref:Uncharacterized protein n=1 Tax=Methylobacterium crusticola TaxID=1697972 RepID=A0ABQ4R2V0_9HYPH|nr:hypothetical protein [Methylobacterium crusticola]GJD51752.1 hypothetical protein OPKNFCMD_4510 [Methylobacterium crusticola]
MKTLPEVYPTVGQTSMAHRGLVAGVVDRDLTEADVAIVELCAGLRRYFAALGPEEAAAFDALDEQGAGFALRLS